MVNTIIIEDERLARECLEQSLHRVDPNVRIAASLSTVNESIAYLSNADDVDLIFSDIHLSDGLSFEIFRHTTIQAPVIFITGFDEFMLNAFECNGIDYLLKPVDEKELLKALRKYKSLEHHFALKAMEAGKLANLFSNRKKSRLLVSKGLENISLRLEDIVLFYTENKIVFVIDNNGKKYLTDKNLSALELELDATSFFRVNRKYIVNLKYIKGFRSYEKVKLQLDISLPEWNERCFIIISQETAPAFRKWMYEA